ncbi:MAG TPA: YdjY domain-containing protein [Melioribacteraceae bacterium]|nr:YdjY domain-containing protein [Melioribacteraceae bacterium]
MKAVVFIILFCVSFCYCQDTSKVNLVKIDENIYKLDNIYINTLEKTVSFNGQINMSEGLIEVFATAKHGKLHEALVVADIVPYFLQVSLLLLGLNSTEFVEYYKNSQKADFLEIYIEWQVNNDTKRYRIEECIWDKSKDREMPKTNWVFIGSRIENGKFMADINRSLITTYNDIYTIIDNPTEDRNNDEIYFVNKKIIPPKNTDVTIIIKALK